MEKGALPEKTASAETVKNLHAAMADRLPEQLTIDDVVMAVVAEVGKVVPMDGETTEQFQNLAKQIMEQAGGQG